MSRFVPGSFMHPLTFILTLPTTQNVATETSWIDVNGGDTVDRCGE